jgi:hypothetical protein
MLDCVDAAKGGAHLPLFVSPSLGLTPRLTIKSHFKPPDATGMFHE